MNRLFCICDDEGSKTKLEILNFIEVGLYHPFVVRAVCVDELGSITTPSIKQIVIIKNDNKKHLDQSKIDRNSLNLYFDIFWDAGMRKVNKKKSKSLFVKIINKKNNRNESLRFVNHMVSDIQQRINSNQLGFSEMHPTTYLNGERWNDQITQEVQNHGQKNQAKFETTSDRYARQSRELQEREGTARGNNQNSTLVQVDGEFIRG